MDTAWNLEYYLGTYGALKWYAWKFFEKYGEQKLAELYKDVHQAWQSAFECKCGGNVMDVAVKTRIVGLLQNAKEAECDAVQIMLGELND